MFIPWVVSERELGNWEDCTWCSGVMFANGVSGANTHPATRAEYEGLRFDATGVREGNGDGSNLRELGDGLGIRYGLTAWRRGRGWPDFMAAAPIGTYFVLQGHTGALPARLRPTWYIGPHCVSGVRDLSLTVAWGDPNRANRATMVRVTLEQARAFYEALPGAEWIVMQREVQAVIGFDVLDGFTGSVTVDGPGHSALDLATGKLVRIPAGTPKEAYALIRVAKGTVLGDDEARRVGYLVGTGAAMLLATDVEPHPVTATPDALAAATLKGAQAEWDLWVQSLGIPDRPKS